MGRREDVDNTIWHDPDFLALPPDARYLYLWTFTNPRCPMSGLYKLSLDVIPVETGLTPKRVREALKALQEARFCFYVDGVIWVRTRVKHMRSKNKFIAKSIAADLERIAPGHPLRRAFLDTYRSIPWLRDHLARFPHEKPTSETFSRTSAERLETFQGMGYISTSPVSSSEVADEKDEEWEEWLRHYRETTGRKAKGSREARGFFRARREDGWALEELMAATVGCHSDPKLREQGYDRPETILRESKVERYINLAEQPPPTGDEHPVDRKIRELGELADRLEEGGES